MRLMESRSFSENPGRSRLDRQAGPKIITNREVVLERKGYSRHTDKGGGPVDSGELGTPHDPRMKQRLTPPGAKKQQGA